jgi:hypothetical protein
MIRTIGRRLAMAAVLAAAAAAVTAAGQPKAWAVYYDEQGDADAAKAVMHAQRVYAEDRQEAIESYVNGQDDVDDAIADAHAAFLAVEGSLTQEQKDAYWEARTSALNAEDLADGHWVQSVLDYADASVLWADGNVMYFADPSDYAGATAKYVAAGGLFYDAGLAAEMAYYEYGVALDYVSQCWDAIGP